MTKVFRVGFDIGGTISKFPEQMCALMRALNQSDEFEVFIITDMNREDAVSSLKKNNIYFDPSRLLCADWKTHMDLCKSVLMKKYNIDIMFDDRPDYIAEGVPIGLSIMPRPFIPYYHPNWKL